jgi:O-antigen ligase
MKKSQSSMRTLDVSPMGWIVAVLSITTLYFQTNLVDPFNSPKMWALLLLSSWLTGYLFRFRSLMFEIKTLKNLFFVITFFASSAVFVSLVTDFKYVAFFGETLRRNGLISYLSLAVIMLASAVFIRIFNVKRIYTIVLFIGLVLLVYGLMQTTGNDFVKWNNPYNSIIGTVGNPNFAAAVMAILGVIIFSSVFIQDFNKYYRIFSLFISLSLFGLIYLSDARQGLLAYVLGCSLFLIVLTYSKSKKMGLVAIFFSLVVFMFALLGMLQIGPFEKLLYKPSVSVRGYYWRAGIEMLKNHPFTGVGMDRYGAYFMEYREVGYPLSYGFDITSSNAHNTFIQFFATGGILLGLSYLLINVFILRRGLVSLKLLTGNQKLLFAGLFSAWVAFHAQSLVSIDNIGISVWGWVLGGAIVGISISATTPDGEDRKYFVAKPGHLDLGRAVISSFFALLAVVLISVLYRGESTSYQARANFNLDDVATKSAFKNLQFNVINAKLIDPNYAFYSGMYLVRGSFVDEGLQAVKSILINDPRNIEALSGLAFIAEQLGKYDEALGYRIEISKLDPWNAKNYLALGKIYKVKGDLINTKAMLDKINSFAGSDPITTQATVDLAP